MSQMVIVPLVGEDENGNRRTVGKAEISPSGEMILITMSDPNVGQALKGRFLNNLADGLLIKPDLIPARPAWDHHLIRGTE